MTHRFGELLVQMGVINQLQLQAALGHQKQWDVPIGRALVDKGLCTVEQVLKALHQQTRLPIIDLEKETLDPKMVVPSRRQIST